MSSVITSLFASASVSATTPSSTGAIIKVFFEDMMGPGGNRPSPQSGKFGSGPSNQGNSTSRNIPLAVLVLLIIFLVSVFLGTGVYCWMSSRRQKRFDATAKQDIESTGEVMDKGHVEGVMEMQVQQVQVPELRIDEVKKRDEQKEEDKDEEENEVKDMAEVKDKADVKDMAEGRVKAEVKGKAELKVKFEEKKAV